MNRSDENDAALVRPKNLQGGTRMGGPRRALSVIDHNTAGARADGVHKRGLQETKDETSDKNQVIPVNRPITRRYAAQLAMKQQESSSFTILTSEEAKKTKPPIKKPTELNSAIIDVEEYQTEKDSPMQMSQKSYQMEEIEMEEILLEPITDIDSSDLKDPLKVTEYIEEIYSYYRKAEISGCVPPTYMEKQIDINERMRAILIDWLVEVHFKFELMDETLFLMVNLIDRFLALQTVERKNLQLVGVTALLLACKYEEISVPVVEDLITITDKAYTRKEVLGMERLIVNRLQFNMCVPTPYVFMTRFLKAAQSDKKLELLSFFFIELCLLEYEMLKFRPSTLAAASIFTAQCTIQRFKHWTKTCEWHTNYSEDQLLECSKLIVTFHQKAEKGKLRAVYKKYSALDFGYATKSEPAWFLL